MRKESILFMVIFLYASLMLRAQTTFGDQNLITGHISKPNCVHAVDLDGDNDFDIITGGSDDRISWWENIDGNGSMRIKQIITTDVDEPRSVYAADLDGDGDMDVLSASSSDWKIAWYENIDGNGTFSAQNVIATDEIAAYSVYAADIDGDGDMDVLCASAVSDRITWYENVGGNGATWEFNQVTTASTWADGARCVYASDIDNDGDMDVLSASALDDKIAWYENSGTGSFGFAQIISLNADGANCVSTADIDNDGDLDVLSASVTDDKVAWYENTDGEGAFGTQQIISTDANGAHTVLARDVDGDNDMDVIASCTADDIIVWYENTDGEGNFSTEQLISGEAMGVNGICAADIDSDGDIDFISACKENHKVCLHFNSGTNGVFEAQKHINNITVGPRSVFISDINNDGKFDVLSASYYDDKIAWYPNIGEGDLFNEQIIISEVTDQPQCVHAADIDGDGDQDVLSASNADDKIAWYENIDGIDSIGSEQIISLTLNGAKTVCAVDIDGDNDLDVLAISLADDIVVWYENIDGGGSFGTQNIIADSVYTATDVSAADIDNDGDMDVVAASFTDDRIIWYENTDGNGAFEQEYIITELVDGIRDLHIADIDGDNDVDVLSASSSDDKIAWYENIDGQGTFSAQQVISTNANDPYSVFAIDIDGDGDTDVLSASNADDKIAWYENLDGNGSFGEQQVISLLADRAYSVYAADLDGDNDNDVVSASFYDNKVAWYENLTLEIIASPEDITACQYTTAVFEVDAKDATIFQWQVDKGTGFVDLENNEIYSGVNTAVLNVFTSEMSYSGYQYRCVAGNNAGNQITGAALLTITEDNENPVIISSHNNQYVDANENCEAILHDYTVYVIAEDNCDMELEITQSPEAGTIVLGTTNLISLTVTDNSGNEAQVSFNVEVIDNTPPIVQSTHVDQVLYANADCEASLANYTNEVVAIDNCGGAVELTQTPIPGTVVFGDENIVTIGVSDDMGNLSEITFNVEVVDTISPIITSTQIDQTVDANENCEAILPDYTGDITAEDNCGFDITQEPTPGTIISGVSNTVVLTVADNSGNSTDFSFYVAVEDVTPPLISCINYHEVEADSNHYYLVSGDEFDPTNTSDNCGIDIVMNDFNNLATLDGELLPEGTTNIIWTAKDYAGNSESCSVEIYVKEYDGLQKIEGLELQLYPNPVYDKLNLEMDANQIKQIKLHNVYGKLLLTETKLKNNMTLDFTVFEEGVYFLKIETQNGASLSSKIVKARN